MSLSMSVSVCGCLRNIAVISVSCECTVVDTQEPPASNQPACQPCYSICLCLLCVTFTALNCSKSAYPIPSPLPFIPVVAHVDAKADAEGPEHQAHCKPAPGECEPAALHNTMQQCNNGVRACTHPCTQAGVGHKPPIAAKQVVRIVCPNSGSFAGWGPEP